MKYYSEKTGDLYETEEKLKVAEKAKDEEILAEQKKREERGKRAKEVQEAYEHYKDLLEKFIKDYDSFHMSINGPDSLFEWFFDHLPF